MGFNSFLLKMMNWSYPQVSFGNSEGLCRHLEKKYKIKPAYINRLDDFYDNYLVKYYNNDFENVTRQYLKTHALIGYVDLVDIVRNSKSKWADKNQYHWVFRNAKLFEKPILNIKGKLRIFELSLLPQEVKKGVLIWQRQEQEQPEEQKAGEQHYAIHA